MLFQLNYSLNRDAVSRNHITKFTDDNHKSSDDNTFEAYLERTILFFFILFFLWIRKAKGLSLYSRCLLLFSGIRTINVPYKILILFYCIDNKTFLNKERNKQESRRRCVLSSIVNRF